MRGGSSLLNPQSLTPEGPTYNKNARLSIEVQVLEICNKRVVKYCCMRGTRTVYVFPLDSTNVNTELQSIRM